MVTVLLATHNGADTLQQTLESLCRIETGGLDWRVIAVDNASTDATPQILRSFATRLPLTILKESQRGKNHALNRGIAAVTSDLVLCIDDDVVLSPGWMLAIKKVFDAQPDTDIVGGLVEPLWPSPLAPWLREAIPTAPAYAVTPPGTADGPCAPSLIFGSNMALRMSLFRSGFRWNPGVGPNGSRFYAMGSETELTVRAHAAGRKVWFCNAASVRHIIDPVQLTRRWLWRRAVNYGRGDVQKARRANPKPGDFVRVFGIPRYTLVPILRHAMGICTAALRNDRRAHYQALWACGYTCGLAYEGRRESRGIKP